MSPPPDIRLAITGCTRSSDFAKTASGVSAAFEFFPEAAEGGANIGRQQAEDAVCGARLGGLGGL